MKDFKIPNSWAVKRLGEVCQVLTGNTPSKSDPSNFGNDIPFIKPPNLQHQIVGLTEEMLSIKGGGKSRLVPENSVFVTCIGNLGRTGIAKQLSAFNQQINAILENKSLSGKFIFYQAQSPNFKLQLEALSAATTVAIVNKGKFETISIVIPPIPEQQRIVAKIEELFSELDKGIETLKAAQQQLKVYKQAVLKYAFEGKLTNPEVKEGELPEGWEIKKIEELSIVIGGLAFKSSEFISEGKYQVIRMGNVRPGVIRFNENPVFVNEIEDKIIEKGLLKLKDVIITQTGTKGKRDYGFTVMIKSENLLLNQRIAAIRCNDKLKPEYLLYFTWTDYFKNQFFANETGNVGQGNVGIKGITLSVLPLPSINEQEQIVQEIESRLSVCDKIEESIEQGLQQAEALRQSILKKAFEGKLVPQDPNDEPASVLLERIKAERAVLQPVNKTKTKKVNT